MVFSCRKHVYDLNLKEGSCMFDKYRIYFAGDNFFVKNKDDKVMKKYSKPSILFDEVVNINEPIYLASGLFDRGDCLITTYEKRQQTISNRTYDVYQIDIFHCAEGSDITPGQENLLPVDHTSRGVNLLVYFKSPVPDQVSHISINDAGGQGGGIYGVPNSNRKVWYFDMSPYYNVINTTQKIGLGSFFIKYLDEGVEVFPSVVIGNMESNDVGFRNSTS